MMTYGPLLETYLGGCVRSDEGTSLTANLQILAENLVAMQGETAAFRVDWEDINLQDEVEEAKATLYLQQARKLELENKKAEGK